MATNIEIKARVADIEALRRKVEESSDGPAQLIVQEDTFFHMARGRLKLRKFSEKSGELIYYERADEAGPKSSHYFISRTAEPGTLLQVLESALGIRGVVRKKRWLYWVGNTRVHLDEVEGLGSFLELEVVLSTGQRIEEGEATARELMTRLEINVADLVQEAYVDLLRAGG